MPHPGEYWMKSSFSTENDTVPSTIVQLTIERPLMSGCVQGHEPTENMSVKL